MYKFLFKDCTCGVHLGGNYCVPQQFHVELFEEVPVCCPQQLHCFAFPPTVSKLPAFPHPHQHLLLFIFLITAILLVSPHAFDLPFLMTNDIEHVFMGCGSFLFGEVSIQVLGPLFSWIVFLFVTEL